MREHTERAEIGGKDKRRSRQLFLAMTDEVKWFDISVRRPGEAFDRSGQLPPSTETFTSIHRQHNHCGDIVKLELEGFREDSQSTMISSGLTLWDASDHLCEFLHTDEELRSFSFSRRLLELGSGLGKCGLLAHRLVDPSRHKISTTLTDGDTHVLQLLRKNVARNEDRTSNQLISCEQLIWGREEARAFRSQQYEGWGFDIILGSDLVYGRSRSSIASWGNMDRLFETVDELLNDSGRFILAHNERGHDVRVEKIVSAASKVNLFHEVLNQDGQIYLLCFRRTKVRHVNSVVKSLQDRNSALEMEIRALRAEKELLQDKCLCLEERCATLAGGKDHPQSILLVFSMDDISCIGSFLHPRDFVNLSLTCKQFGHRSHNIENHPVSIWQMIAYRLYQSASDREKESLPVYRRERSPFIFYNELLELRKPLKFNQLFGSRFIAHTDGDESQVVNPKIAIAVKSASSDYLSAPACTAVSNHVMREGKHYVTFTCPKGPRERDVLWFGIVRPLQRTNPRSNALFTPFSARIRRELNELQTGEWGECNVHCCVYMATSGRCQWTDWSDHSTNDGRVTNWKGMQSFEGGTIGMLLDYDVGTLTVFKNGVRLGVMKEDLSGPYSWMVSVRPQSDSLKAGIKIERGAHWVHATSPQYSQWHE